MDAPVPTFADDIRPLFRERDRSSMTFLFDLWSYDDVRSNAGDIGAALEAGEMPCDGPWSAERIALFQAWVAGGFAP
ncbi:MAG TPA: hypothetical protein VF802_07305 [Candidatus Limnocylindrales bacterium]